MIDNPVSRRIIAAALGETVNSTTVEHFNALTQEPQLTSRIAQALETGLPKLRDASGYNVSVITQELPDRGRGALEKEVGADLYIGIEVRSGHYRVSKGALIQSKWRDAPMGTLPEQCDNIWRRTSAAYVWIYGDRGVRVVSAANVARNPDLPIKDRYSTHPDRMFDRILACRAGDRSIGLPDLGPDAQTAQIRQEIGIMLRELRIRTGVGVVIAKWD